MRHIISVAVDDPKSSSTPNINEYKYYKYKYVLRSFFTVMRRSADCSLQCSVPWLSDLPDFNLTDTACQSVKDYIFYDYECSHRN